MNKAQTERHDSYERARVRLYELLDGGCEAYLTEGIDGKQHIVSYIPKTQEWRSSVLQCDACDDQCNCCKFLAGDRTDDVMYAVIVQLDVSLAVAERQIGTLTKALATKGESLCR